jgi:uncharacterized membrane protein YoaK (UPF0700 family)
MSDASNETPVKEKWIAQVLLLTWVAGTIDAIGYLALGHVFTANMTGNAVLLGIAIGQRQGLAAIRSIVALAGFVLGVSIGALLAHRSGPQASLRRAFLGPALVEAIILAAFALVFHLPSIPRNQTSLYVLIALSAVAMGIQSAAVRRLNLPGIATTVITVTITSLIAGLVRWLHLTVVSSPMEEPAGASASSNRHLGLQAGVFLTYVAAAAASGLFQNRFSLAVGLSPLVAITLVLLKAVSSEKPSPRPSSA